MSIGVILLASAGALFCIALGGLFILFDRCSEEARSSKFGAGCVSASHGDRVTTAMAGADTYTGDAA